MGVKERDPLAFDLERIIAELLAAHPHFIFPNAFASEDAKTNDKLNALARLLAFPALTDEISTRFRPLLMDLCARWLELDNLEEHRVFEAFALLLHPHNEIFPIMLHYLSHPNRMDGPLAFIPTSNVPELPARPLHRLLTAYHRLLIADETLPERSGWSLVPLAQLIHAPHPDPGVRVLAILCYSLQVGQAESVREESYWESLGEPGEVDAPIEIGERLQDDTVIPIESDSWIIGFLEDERQEARENALSTPQNYFVLENEPIQLTAADLSSHIINMSGVLTFKADPTPSRETELVITPSAHETIQTLALLLSDRLPALIHSTPGAGKSLLIKHLAAQLFPSSPSQVISLHLSDTSIDPKSLIGSYVPSSTKSGSFEWVEGPLCSAMRAGKWLVFEDIDKASSEVLGTILPLVETLGPSKGPGDPAELFIPSRDMTIRAQPGFALFATCSLNATAGMSPRTPSFLGSHHWYPVHLPAPVADEQHAIVSSLFPRLLPSATRELVRVFEGIKAVASIGSAASSSSSKARDIGMRDLIKWVRRVEQYFPTRPPRTAEAMDVDTEVEDGAATTARVLSNPEVKDRIFLDARDIFFGSTSSAPHTIQVGPASQAAEQLSLSREQAEWVVSTRTPELQVERSPSDGHVVSIMVGRVNLSGRPPSRFQPPPNPTVKSFALHRPSLVLLEQLASAARFAEPLLLVGETGTGKTTAIQHLASLLSHPLTVFNLSNQTEVSDLVGGFKPIDAKVPGSTLQARFIALFNGTFNARRNVEFDQAIRKAVQGGKWKRAVAMWRDAVAKAVARIREVTRDQLDSDAPRKRRKFEAQLDPSMPTVSEDEWADFERDLNSFEAQHVLNKAKFAFAFVEGPLVRAIREGHWVLLDEINLASSETLEAIAPLLQSPTSSLTLTEQGTLEPVPRHPSFRLFASMNPATDVGKKDLPPVMRSSFTELWVPPPDSDREALLAIITQRIGHIALAEGRSIIADVADFYESVRKLSELRQISDTSNQRPHFSMRTLSRALTFAADLAPSFGLRRAIWEGCLMAFTMALDSRSSELVRPLAERHLLSGVKNKPAFLAQTPSYTTDSDEFVTLGPFRLQRGPKSPDPMDDYVLTPSVQTKLIDLSRIVCTRRFPVLIEGPTSAGKTSSIEYLARRTGHQFVRINNHEHTDIQEYIGTYVSDPNTGKLVFRDGVLVRALRQGHWLVLDELNLAPTDVLEALNRLLDDNRELLIPETQEIVTPHPAFVLFATQNPPGLYAGRKVLSRAFRNRFLEVHFTDVPQAELETIIHQRSRIAPSYANRIVSVFRELQSRRQAGRVFESKLGFATLRDLFRWAGRGAVGYQQLAEDGYMLLAERARQPEDKAAVKAAIESVMKVKINASLLYDLQAGEGSPAARLALKIPASSKIIWTSAFQRVFVLAATALQNHEPVLLVGDTGAGKTSVCQYLADVLQRDLYALNCHQNTETADLLGGQRPIRNRSALRIEACSTALACLHELGITVDATSNDVHAIVNALDKAIRETADNLASQEQLRQARRALKRSESLFEWSDGPLVKAIIQGDIFLMDEISLADDSVLERLNSVLEPERTLVLAEKGGWAGDYASITASAGFELMATMNPGGDYGKKELSPALRNRFTEIWVPQIDDRNDRKRILDSMWKYDELRLLSDPILDVVDTLSLEIGDTALFGLRDIQAWASFSNVAFEKYGGSMSVGQIFHHGARLTVLDGLATLPQLAAMSAPSLQRLEARAIQHLTSLIPLTSLPSAQEAATLDHNSRYFTLEPFRLELGNESVDPPPFSLDAPTTRQNALRVTRACQLGKPILLEGSPGVGKTSLITALAAYTQHRLCRVNLSDQSDIMDLFGSDLPVEGGLPGEFQWRDAAFLRALQEGEWVLLDEMNLAPQAVLEGLNAVLDHRGSVYIPELGRTFKCHPDFRIFAAQNPLGQGGGRKGLPKSFLNRFTKVYIQELKQDDLLAVCRRESPDMDVDILKAMIRFNSRIHVESSIKRNLGTDGAPWEFNLRDVLRWIHLTNLRSRAGGEFDPSSHLSPIYLQRFRTQKDRVRVAQIFEEEFPALTVHRDVARPSAAPTALQVGRAPFKVGRRNLRRSRGSMLQQQLATSEAAGSCLNQGWMVILVGNHGSGKTTLAKLFAEQMGYPLEVIPMNPSVDTTDLLGNFEQVDSSRGLISLIQAVVEMCEEASSRSIAHMTPSDAQALQLLRRALNISLANATWPELVINARKVLSMTEAPELESLLDSLSQQMQLVDVGRFDWVDGPLVRAMKSGRWVLLDNANLCSPAVLDRLNSLTEANGSLTLSERGLVNGEVVVLRPHPNFRLLMTLDPAYGELSRAMRNRGVEMFLDANLGVEVEVSTSHHHLHPIPSTPSVSSPVFSSQHLRRGMFDNPRSVRRLKLHGSRNSESVKSTLNLLSAILKGGPSPSIVFMSAFVNYATSPLEWNRTLRALPLILTDEEAGLQAVQLFKDIWNGPLSALMQRPTSSTATAPSDEYIWKYLDAQLNPHLTSSRLGLLSQPYQSIALAARLAGHVRTPSVPAQSPLHVSSLLNSGYTPPGSSHEGVRWLAPIIELCEKTAEEVLRTQRHVPGDPIPADMAAANEVEILGSYLQRVSSTNPFNLTATRAINQWLSDALPNASSAFDALRVAVHSLHSLTSLRTGQSMITIWQALLTATPNEDLVALERSLVALLRPMSSDMTTLRASAFDLVAALNLRPEPSSFETQEITELGNQLLRKNPVDNAAYQVRQESKLETSVVVAEFELLARSWIGERRKKHADLLLSNLIQSDVDMVDWVPLKALTWIWDVSAGQPLNHGLSLQIDAQRKWMMRLWAWASDPVSGDLAAGTSSHSHPSWKASIGPSKLSKAFLLLESLNSWEQTAVTLRSLGTEEAYLTRQRQLALAVADKPIRPRASILTSLLLENVVLIIKALGSSYESTVFERILQAVDEYHSDSATELGDLAPLLCNSRVPSVSASFSQHISPILIRHILVEKQDENGEWVWLGEAWMAFSRLLIDLYIPDAVLDPLLVQECEENLVTIKSASLSEALALLSKHEKLLTGNSRNGIIDQLSMELDVYGPRHGRRPLRKAEISRVEALFTEITRFTDQVLPRLDHLNLHEDHSSAESSASVMQGTISGFIQRLASSYSDLDDLTRPLLWALECLRVGLGIRSAIWTIKESTQLTESLIKFPSIAAAHDRQRPELNSIGSTYRLHQIAGIVYEVSVDGDISIQLTSLRQHYTGLMHLWLRDRERERREGEEASSIYKPHKLDHDARDDDDIDEEDFNRLFPSFGDDAETVPIAPSALPPGPHLSQNQNQTSSVTQDQMRELLHMHLALFSAAPPASRSTRAIYTQRRRNYTAEHVRTSELGALPASLDDASQPWRLSLLEDKLKDIQHKGDSQSLPNFYREPNVVETRRAIPILQALRSRLQSILQEWPDQMVLQHLIDHVDRILSLSIKSPIAQVLSAVERLLLLTDDWEGYSNRENSLKVHQSALITLIVDWRRLELRCWYQLLDAEMVLFNEGVAEWWFRLYEMLVLGTLSAAEAEDNEQFHLVDQHFQRCVPLIDEYIASAPLGQFQVRLELLHSFARLSDLLSAEVGPSKAAFMGRMASLVRSQAGHYGFVLSDVQAELSRGREPIQKEIQDYIKLASWKDINVYALKQSAEKTHKHLHRCIRKYRDLLRRPVSAVNASPFRPILASPPSKTASLFLTWSSTVPVRENTQADIPRRFLHLDDTLGRFRAMLREEVDPLLHGEPASFVEDISSRIIERIQAFSSAPISEDKEKRRKSINSLVAQKRRALVDLMKELRRLGVSQTPKPDALALQQSRARLFELSLPSQSSDPALFEAVSHGDRYYHRLIDGVQVVRDSMSSHHSDFTTRDLQRLLSLTESLFNLGIVARKKLASTMNTYNQLVLICARLHSITETSSGHIATAGVAVRHDVEALTVQLCRITDAVDELLAHAGELSAGPSDFPVGQLDEILAYAEQTRSLRISMSSLKESLCGNWMFLTQEEERIVQATHAHIRNLRAVLTRTAKATLILAPTCQAVVDWLDKSFQPSLDPSPSPSPSPPVLATTVIDSMLLAAQDLRSWAGTSQFDDDDNLFLRKSVDINKVVVDLRQSTLLRHIEGFLSDALVAHPNGLGYNEEQLNIVSFRPFLEDYLRTSQAALIDIAVWTKSVLKLAWIVCSLVHDLAKNGLCKPPDEESDPNSKAGDQGEAQDASGLGTGTGDKNISNEIEDESQVEGLQGEESAPPPPAGGPEDEDDALEMEDDFEGDLEDPADADGDDGAESDQEDDKSELDDQVQDLEPNDENAVDEKLWSDEKGPDDSKTGKDQEHQAPKDQENNETEIVAKEERDQQSRNESNDMEQQDNQPSQEDETAPEDNEHDEDAELPEDSEMPDQGRRLDDHLQESETLDIPEDMDLDVNGDAQSDHDAPESDDEAMGEIEDDEQTGDAEAEDGEVEPAADASIQDGEEQSKPDQSAQAETEKIDNTELDDVQAETAPPEGGKDQKGGQAGSESAVQGGVPIGDQSQVDQDSQERSEDNGTSANDDKTIQKESRQSESHPNQQPHDSSAAAEGQTGDAQSAPSGDTSSAAQPNDTPNPLRNLGDTMKSIRRRFEEIMDRADDPNGLDVSKPPVTERQDDAQMEYAAPSEEDLDEQALGPSRAQDEISKLRELHIDDQTTSADPPTQPDDSSAEQQDRESGSFEPFSTIDAVEAGRATPSRENADDSDLMEDIAMAHGADAVVPNTRDAPTGEAPDPAQAPDDEIVEIELRQWQLAGQPSDGARDLWRRYTAITHHLAYDLCEQLRLILEPTLATRLKGDYRTGKRLNMKKVIPYIASEFTKDKIWLRRTRPSKREYQVLLALDDSKSMREGRAAHLAFESLALVVKALDRLEAGDTAVVRFGETVDVLHDFESSGGGAGFSDEAGAKVLQNFNFDQRATNVLSLVERSLEVLADARVRKTGGSANAADLWQLEIIISDGICQDHDKLRTMLRRAHEQRVMIVFVIVDGLRNQGTGSNDGATGSNSILNMNHASYAMVNGKMELQLQRYLDLFPFEYYVVLRDVESLPEVLAGTLRQFFEHMSEE